jgi:hypothetical protein
MRKPRVAIGRRVQRTPFGQSATLLIGSPGERPGHSCHIIDATELGVRVSAKAALSRGQPVEVVPRIGLGTPLAARVVWVGEAGSPNRCQAGLEFRERVASSFWGLPLPVAPRVPNRPSTVRQSKSGSRITRTDR